MNADQLGKERVNRVLQGGKHLFLFTGDHRTEENCNLDDYAVYGLKLPEWFLSQEGEWSADAVVRYRPRKSSEERPLKTPGSLNYPFRGLQP